MWRRPAAKTTVKKQRQRNQNRSRQKAGLRTKPAIEGKARTAVWLVIGLTALNVVSTLLECGFGACADDPVAYELLKRGG